MFERSTILPGSPNYYCNIDSLTAVRKDERAQFRLRSGTKKCISGEQKPEAKALDGWRNEHAPAAVVVPCRDVAFLFEAGDQALYGRLVDAELFTQTVDSDRWLASICAPFADSRRILA